jgi:hypothetical protein
LPFAREQKSAKAKHLYNFLTNEKTFDISLTQVIDDPTKIEPM